LNGDTGLLRNDTIFIEWLKKNSPIMKFLDDGASGVDIALAKKRVLEKITKEDRVFDACLDPFPAKSTL